MSQTAKTTVKTVIAGIVLVLAAAGLLLHANVPQVPSNAWAPAGDMKSVRAGASGTLLPNGLVLIAGGVDANGTTASAERFSPDGAHFLDAPSMQVARANHTATLLADGRVLVAGGTGAGSAAGATAEIYDSSANVWLPAGSLNVARRGHTATRLPDGKVLIAGGDDNGVAIDSLEIFDPATTLFTVVDGASSGARTLHAAAPLLDGRVLIAGGFDGTNPLASTSIYDPEANTVSAGPDLSTPRSGMTATTLLDGRVLVAGGAGASGELASAEIFDPATNAFTSTDNALSPARQNHLAFLLPHNNQVLIVGGLAGGNPVAAAEYFTSWEGTNGVFCAQAICASGYAGPAQPATARAWATGSALSFPADTTIRTGPNDGLLVLAGGSGQKSGELFGFATVRTDKEDYSPGTTVTITGSGWQPGETVALTLVESPLLDTHPLLPVTADNKGNIVSTEFAPDAHDVNVRFYLTAYGSASHAQTTFEDANDVTVTPATGGSAIPANTVGGVYTNLTGPILIENGAGAIGTGNIVLNIPTGFEFDTGGTAPNVKVTSSGVAGHNINNLPSGSTISATVTTTTITISITAKSNSGDQNTLTWQNVRVRPTAASPLASGNITKAVGGSSYTLASGSPSTYGTLTEVKANQSIIFGALGAKTYGDSNFAVTATASSGLAVTFTASGSCTVDGDGDPVHLTGVGSCTITARQAGNGVYNAAPDVPQTFSINKATAVVVVTPYTVTYDGNPHTATVTSITGVNGETGATVGTVTLNTTHTNAGNYNADTWSFTGAANYNNIGATTITDTINKANATVVVTPYTVTYDGSPHTAPYTITGVNGESGATVGAVTLNTTHTNAATYSSDTWSFAGAANYNDIASTTITDVINKANATVVVTPYTVTYDGQPHTATYTITGVNGENGATVGAVTLNTTHTNAATYSSDTWSFAGAANYNNIASTTITDVINKANATVVVTPYTVTYDSNPHTATYAITGVNGESGATVGTVTLNTTHTNAAAYSSDTWSFTGAGNYNDIASTTITDTINKANAVVVVTPYTVTYDANPHTATYTVTGVAGDPTALGSGVTLNTTHTAAAIYNTDSWSFAGGTNYNDIASTTITDTINKATSTTLVTFEAGPYTYRGTPFAATAQVTGVGGLNAPIPVVYTGDCTNVTVANGCTATATFAGDGNHLGSFDSKSITIPQASTTTTVTPSPNPSIVGEAVSLTADVSDSPAGSSGNRTGLVTFYDGTTVIGSAVLSSNQAVFTTSVLVNGAHSLSAVYAGDTNFIGSTSPAASQQVNTRPTTTALSLSPNSVAVGVSSTAIATVTDTTGSPAGAGTFGVGTALPAGRTGAAAALLPDGRVLVAGGDVSGTTTAGAIIYDPATGVSTPTGSMTVVRRDHSATRLANGTILIAGGQNAGVPLFSAEVFDPATGAFTALGAAMTVDRADHAAALLADGRVLIIGGMSAGGRLASAETFAPNTGLFSALSGNDLTRVRAGHSATLLPGGTVLIAGGVGDSGTESTMEIYDPSGTPSTGTSGMTQARANHSAMLLPNGLVLVAGGFNGGGGALQSAELFNPITGSSVGAGPMNVARADYTATLLNNGRVLLTGGVDDTSTVLASTETYTPVFNPIGIVGVTSTVSSDAIPGTCELLDPTAPGANSSKCLVAVTPAVVAGPHTITAAYSDDSVHGGSSDHKDLTVVKGTPTIDWSTPAAITYGTALDGTQLNATASYSSNPLPGSFVYTPASGVVLPAGPHMLHVAFTPDDTDDYETASADVSLTVNTKPLTITANNQNKTYGTTFMFAGTEFTPVGLTNGDTIATVTLNSAGAATSAGVGGSPYTITPSAPVFGTGSASNYGISYVDGHLTVTRAHLTVKADDKTKTYDGAVYSPFTATLTGFANSETDAGLRGSGALSGAAAFTGAATTAVDAGTYTITPSSGTLMADNYDFTVFTNGTLTIDKAPSTTLVTFEGGPYTYRGTAFTATAQVTGAGSLNQSVAVGYSGDCTNVTSVNGCTATATFAGDINHLSSSDSKSITIAQAPSTTVVTFEAGPYTYRGTAFTATAQVTGVGGLNQSVAVGYSGDCTNVTGVNGCTATATFAGDINHLGSSDSKSITMAQAPSTTVVTFEAGPYTYRGTAFTATALVTGVGGLNQSVAVGYSGDCTNVTGTNGCTASATFGGDTNHLTSSDSKSITITQATPTVSATTGGPFTFDGAPHGGSGTATGVGGPSDTLSPAVTVQYAGIPPISYGPSASAPSEAGTYQVRVNFTGNTNYTSGHATANVIINQATSTTTVACPSNLTFNGNPQTPCTVSVTGAGGLNLTPTPTYANNVNVGTASASYTYAGDANHTGSSDSKTFAIDQAAVTATAGSGSSVFDGSPHSPSACVVTGLYTGDLTCANYPSSVGPAAGTTPIVPVTSGTGLSNFAIATVNGSYTISQATSTTAVTFEAGPYTYRGTPFTATAEVTGAGGLSQSVAVVFTSDCTNVTVANGCTATATFGGDVNHTGSSDAKSITITQATPTLSATGGTFTYDGTPHGGSGTATGVGGPSDTLTPAVTVQYAGIPPISYGPSASAPSGAGTYQVRVNFAGNTNYTSGHATANVIIGQAASLTTVTCPASTTYNGSAQTLCSAAATGIGGLNQSLIVTYASNTNVGTANASATFGGDTNHTGSNGATTFSITAAAVTITAGSGSSTFDGTSKSPSACVVSGAYTVGLTCGNNPVTVGPGAGSTMISPIVASGPSLGNFVVTPVNGSYTINKANAMIVVAPYNVAFDGNPHTATGSATGVGGASLTGLNITATTHTAVNSYSDPWTFTDVTGNYNNANGVANDVISSSGYVCDTASTIPARFSYEPIASARYIWFNNIFRILHVGHGDFDGNEDDDRDDGDEDDNNENEVWEDVASGARPVIFFFTNQAVTFKVGSTTYTLPVPDGQITFSNAVSVATTNYSGGKWFTTLPAKGLKGRVFASGLAYKVPVPGLPGNINPVSWTAKIASDTPGLKVRWRWGASVYSSLGPDSPSLNLNGLGIKVASGNKFLPYTNNDRVGTPENFKGNVLAGARSHGHNPAGWRSQSATTGQCGLGTWTTYTQSDWSSNPSNPNNAGSILAAKFNTVYPGGSVKIGNANPGKFMLTFTSAAAIKTFLPAGGKAGVLQANGSNPSNSKGGTFAGQVLALQLNVDFSNAAVIDGGLALLKIVDGDLEGQTVQQVLDLANFVLGGGSLPAGLTLNELNDIVTSLNENFDGGKIDRGFVLP